jgi:hypothetical protein
MEELIADYESGNLHPGDLKSALNAAINKILQVIISVLGTTILIECACFESLYLQKDLNVIFFCFYSRCVTTSIMTMLQEICSGLRYKNSVRNISFIINPLIVNKVTR